MTSLQRAQRSMMISTVARRFPDRRSRRTGLVASLLAASAMTVTGLGVPIQAEAAPLPAASVQDVRHAVPGSLVSAEEWDRSNWPTGTAAAWKVRYHSVGSDGHDRVVSGVVLLPEHPTKDKDWPVISYAHGAVGLADDCAPSSAGMLRDEKTFVGAWLQQGYVVTATDYEGLGTPGAHPFLDGRSLAHSVADIVRAARNLDNRIGRRWVVAGFSQGGGAALITASLAPRYARELNLAGAVALSPASNWRQLWAETQPYGDTPVSVVSAYVLASLRATRPGFRLPAYATAVGQNLADQADSLCLVPMFGAVSGITTADVESHDLARDKRFLAELHTADIPVRKFVPPAYLAQGLIDTTIPPSITDRLDQQLESAGNDVRFETFPDTDHAGILAAALPGAQKWVAQRMP
jgi:pimeloyl-ACP methyl ester carboxylesterase